MPNPFHKAPEITPGTVAHFERSVEHFSMSKDADAETRLAQARTDLAAANAWQRFYIDEAVDNIKSQLESDEARGVVDALAEVLTNALHPAYQERVLHHLSVNLQTSKGKG